MDILAQLTHIPADNWVLLLAVLLSNVTSGMFLTSFSVFYVELRDKFDASSQAVGWIGGMFGFFSHLLGIFVSHPVHVYGCRMTAVVGGIIAAVGFMLSSLSPSLTWIYLLVGLVSGAGHAVAYLLCDVIIQQRFTTGNGFAIMISYLGFSIASFIGPHLVNALCNGYGVMGALALHGAVIFNRLPLGLTFNTPKHLLLRHSVPDDESKAGNFFLGFKTYITESLNFRLLLHRSFASVCLCFFIQKCVVNSFMLHLVSFGLKAGLAREHAVWAPSLIALVVVATRILLSAVSDSRYISRVLLYACSTVSGALAVAVLLSSSASPAVWTSMVLYGFYQGTTVSLYSVIVVDLVGVENLARGVAISNFIGSFSALLGPPLVGWLYDRSDSYFAGFLLLDILIITSTLLSLLTYVLDKRDKARRRQAASLADNTELN